MKAFLLACVLCALTFSVVQASPNTQQNLLNNPGFDSAFDGGVATGWNTWWREPEKPAYPEACQGVPTRTPAPSATPEPCQPYRRPSFQDSASGGNRVHSGNNAQKIFTSNAVFDAGVYQQVTGVIIGQKYRFVAYLQGASVTGQTSMGFQVGIDPNGGTDPFNASIVWGTIGSALDSWQVFGADAVAKSSTISVFIRAAPKIALARNEVFIDDAALYAIFANSDPIIGVPSLTTPVAMAASETPSQTATVRVTPTWPPTSTPRANGEVWYTVRSGDTLVVIAFYHKVSVDSIKQLNGLASNSIIPGQRLLITVQPPPPTTTGVPLTPSLTFTPSQTPELVQLPTETPRPLVVLPTYGQVCVIAYNDANANGRNDAELPMPNVRVTLSDGSNKPVDGYVTTGNEPQRCFGQLAPGKYVVTVVAPTGFITTTTHEFAVQVEAAKAVTLVFGVSVANRVEAVPPSPAPLTLLIVLVSATVLLVLAGIAVVVFTKRK